MQKLIGNEYKVILRDELTGEYYTLEGITEFEDTILDDEENEVVGQFFKDTTFSCEIENAAELGENIIRLFVPKLRKNLSDISNDTTEKCNPNPVYVPKHIAKRRKW